MANTQLAKIRILALVLFTLLACAPTTLRAEGDPVPPVQVSEQPAQPGQPRKVILFYIDVGQGHESAAKAIKSQVEAQQPGTIVEMKNMRDFIPSRLWEKVDKKLFWFVVKNTPFFEGFYQSHMQKGREANNLQDLGTDIDHTAVAKWLAEQKPDAVIATHYGSAQVLSNLRQDGKFDKPIAWLHTDYVEGYFPRISKAIDMSFLPHPELGPVWQNAGVDPKKVAITGMPISNRFLGTTDRAKVLGDLGLDPKVKTVTIASGAEGVGDFASIVKQLGENTKEPLQVVAVCGNSKENFANLTALQGKLPANIKLIVKGFDKGLPDYVKSSDVYVTKAGGLSPTEAFAAGVPTVVMEVYHGHEGENANLFERLGLALINREPARVGKDVLRLMGDKPMQEKMRIEQAKFRDSLTLQPVVDFALKATSSVTPANQTPGFESGKTYGNVGDTLAKLDKDLPHDFELLMSYPKGKGRPGGDGRDGHLAIRIGDKVYVYNKSSNKLVEVPANEYFYGTAASHEKGEKGVTHGVSFERDTFGLRVKGVKPEQLRAMLAEIRGTNGQLQGGLDGKSSFLIARILAKANLGAPANLSSEPLQLMLQYKKAVEGNPALQTAGIAYGHTPGLGKHPTTNSSYLNTVLKIFGGENDGRDLLTTASKRVTTYVGDGTIHYEDVDGVSQEKIKTDRDRLQKMTEERIRAMRDEEKVVNEAYEKLQTDGHTPERVTARLSEFAATLTPAEAEAVKKGELGPPLAGEKLAKARELKEFLQLSNARMKDFHEQYDKFNANKLDHLVEMTYLDVKTAAMEMALRLPPGDNAALKKKMKEIDEQYNLYKARRGLYNQPKDVLRIFAVREIFGKSREFIQQADAALRKRSGQGEAPPTPGILGKLRGIGNMVSLAAGFIKTYMTVQMTPSRTGNHHTPVTEGVFAGMSLMGQLSGMKVKVEGKANMPKPGRGKVVNLYTIQHAHPLLDNMAVSQLGLKDFAIFGAVDDFGLGKQFADKLDASDHFIAVGRGSDKPIEKTLDLLKRGKVNDFVIYPEGSVSAGIYETRQPRDKMAWGLIRRLQAEGYEVNITPISLPQNYRYNDIHGEGETVDPNAKELKVVVGKPISARMLETLQGLTGEDISINQLIRQTWMSERTHDAESVAGMLRVDPLLERAGRYLFGGVRCPFTSLAFGR